MYRFSDWQLSVTFVLAYKNTCLKSLLGNLSVLFLRWPLVLNLSGPANALAC